MIIIYGIKNCDTMKKAFAWLNSQGIDFTFHDYKTSGIDDVTLARWENSLGWETLLNRRGTTWRKLDTSTQANINRDLALLLMQQQPSLIKRPVLAFGPRLLCGFDEKVWQEALGK